MVSIMIGDGPKEEASINRVLHISDIATAY
jgi:hypothetical protein